MTIIIGPGITVGSGILFGAGSSSPLPPEPEPQPQFPNDDFSLGLAGWTVWNNQVFFTNTPFETGYTPTTLAGFQTPVLPNPYPYGSMWPFNGWSINQVYSSALNSDMPVGVTGQSVRLTQGTGNISTSGVLATGFSGAFGPAIFSNYMVTFNAGDSCRFYWRAISTTDAFNVYAYMVNVDTGAYVSLLRETAPNLSYSTGWRTQTTVVPTAGTYKYVFVSGAWDSTGGRSMGALFAITNIERIPV